MLSQLRIENFKAFADSGEVPLAPLTILIGKNNTGKSSVFHALLALKQAAEDRRPSPALVTSGQHIDLGSYRDIHHQGAEAEEPIRFTIGLDSQQNRRFATRFFEEDESKVAGRSFTLSLAFKFNVERNHIVVSTSRISYGDKVVAEAVRAGRGYRAPMLPSKYLDHVKTDVVNFLPYLSAFPEAPPEDSSLMNKIVREYLRWQNAYQGWMRIFQASLEHVSPLRKIIPRYSGRGEAPGSWVGVGGAALLRELRSEEFVYGSRTLLQHLDQWVSEEFEFLDELKLQPLDKTRGILALVGREPDVSETINVASMGAGISQLLPIIAAVVKTPPLGCLLVEQPEIHLHPAAQADVADLFIDGIRRGARQYIVETHSEHLLLRIRRRVAEEKLDPNNVSVLFVEKRQGRATMRRIPVTPTGDVEEWPDGFFEEDYEEALALTKAAAQHR